MSNDRIGERMAGPGIRYWELAQALAVRHQVTLVAPGMTWTSDTFRCVRRGSVSWMSLMADQDVAVGQLVTAPMIAALRRTGTAFVLDAYDPMEFETLEQNKFDPPALRRARERSLHGIQTLAFLLADGVVCASERQRDLWLGTLLALGRIGATTYDADDTLRQLIDVVPFGCQSAPPRRSGPGPRELFGLPEDTVIALWGGGIWEWFDPLTIIEAMSELSESHPRLALVFMGVASPGESSVASAKARRTEELVDHFGLRDRSVFFSYGWVPYDQRQSFLLDADVGVSAHLDHTETRFAFRTRVLDYFWAGLPCLVTEGDSMADLVAERGAGRVLGFTDVAGWTKALAELVEDPGARQSEGIASASLAAELTWPMVASRLEAVCARVVTVQPKPLSLRMAREMFRYYANGFRAIGLDGGLSALVSWWRAERS